MAKLICLIFGVFMAVSAVSSSSSVQLKNAINECKNEIGVTEKPGQDLMAPFNPATDNPILECFKACFMKKIRYIVDGKLNLENIFAGENVPASEQWIFNRCSQDKLQKTTNDCEVANSFFTCMETADASDHPRSKQ